MKISELLEEKVEMCSKACCGQPVTECKCGPDCKHCDCHAKNKAIKETTSAGSVAAVAAPIGGMQKRQPKNSDGTAKNALDSDTLMAGKKKKAYSKKA